jgi:hypothetical protein
VRSRPSSSLALIANLRKFSAFSKDYSLRLHPVFLPGDSCTVEESNNDCEDSNEDLEHSNNACKDNDEDGSQDTDGKFIKIEIKPRMYYSVLTKGLLKRLAALIGLTS